jgi:hypothetical protein
MKVWIYKRGQLGKFDTYEQVRMLSVYPHPLTNELAGELVMHFSYPRPQMNIPMDELTSFSIQEEPIL